MTAAEPGGPCAADTPTVPAWPLMDLPDAQSGQLRVRPGLQPGMRHLPVLLEAGIVDPETRVELGVWVADDLPSRFLHLAGDACSCEQVSHGREWQRTQESRPLRDWVADLAGRRDGTRTELACANGPHLRVAGGTDEPAGLPPLLLAGDLYDAMSWLRTARQLVEKTRRTTLPRLVETAGRDWALVVASVRLHAATAPREVAGTPVPAGPDPGGIHAADGPVARLAALVPYLAADLAAVEADLVDSQAYRDHLVGVHEELRARVATEHATSGEQADALAFFDELVVDRYGEDESEPAGLDPASNPAAAGLPAVAVAGDLDLPVWVLLAPLGAARVNSLLRHAEEWAPVQMPKAVGPCAVARVPGMVMALADDDVMPWPLVLDAGFTADQVAAAVEFLDELTPREVPQVLAAYAATHL